MLLRNKVALITGSARGTGAGIARVFAKQGARVVINQVKDEGAPDALLNELREQGGEVIFIPADITEEDQVKRTMHEAEMAYGQIDILVNNYVDPIKRALFANSHWPAWQEQFDYTVKAAWFCSQAVLPGMR